LFIGVSLTSCIYGWYIPSFNNPPFTPDTPIGPTEGKPYTDYMYSTKTADPDDDQLYFLWDWGDENNSEWLGRYLTDEECKVFHSWVNIGRYDVKVKAKDINGAESRWSESLTVVIYLDDIPPYAPTVSGSDKGTIKVATYYNITAIDPEGSNVSYFINWGDDTNSEWIGPYSSGVPITKFHTWSTKVIYTIKAKARDEHGGESNWGTLTVAMPYSFNKLIQPFLELLFERFPNAFPLLRQLLGC
jgi:hypothetical protein